MDLLRHCDEGMEITEQFRWMLRCTFTAAAHAAEIARGIARSSTARRCAASPRLSYAAVVATLECAASAATLTMSTPASSRFEMNDLRQSCGDALASEAAFVRRLRI